jgi:predicted transcriptional regulator
MAPSNQPVAPRPVLVSFHPWVARDILAEIIPWDFCKRRSGHETGTQVLMYASGKERTVVGTYTAGTVFEYQSLPALKESVHRSEIARFGEDEINEEWLEEIFEHLPHGWAIEICKPRPLIPRLALGRTADGKKMKGPHGFQYLDLRNPDHARLWSQIQASCNSQEGV